MHWALLGALEAGGDASGVSKRPPRRLQAYASTGNSPELILLGGDEKSDEERQGRYGHIWSLSIHALGPVGGTGSGRDRVRGL